MKSVWPIIPPGFILAILCLFGQSALANWQPLLVQGDHPGYRVPTEPFRLKIPADIPDDTLQSLALELDAVDITAMIEREGDFAIFKPIQPLATGRHELRIVEYAPDGSILELGFWSFEVRQSALFREYSAAAETQVTTSYRVADEDLDQPTANRLQAQGSSQVGFSADNGDWHTRGQFDLLLDSIKESQPNGRALDNGEFLLNVGNRYVDARIGHQNVGTPSLVMDSFRRRGASLEGRIPAFNSQITGFSLATRDLSGFSHGLAIGDEDRRVNGITFASNPLSGHTRALYLSGTFLQGRGRDDGGMVASIDGLDPDITKGSAWSLSADSQLFSDRLRLRAEYAGTSYDYSLSDTLGAEDDTAYSLLATFNDVTAHGLNWNLGAEAREIGTFFKSLANQALPSDRRLVRTFGGLQWSTLGLQGSFEQQQDNVENIAQLPWITTDLGSLSLNWSPQPKKPSFWLGTPSFNLTYSQQTQNQTRTPSGYLGTEADNRLQSWQGSITASYPRGNWGVALISSSFRDQTGLQSDTDTRGATFDGSLNLDRLTLAPAINYDQTEDQSTHQTSTGITYSLQTSFILLPDKLSGSCFLSLNQNQTTDDSIDSDTFSANLALNWLLLAAQRNRPGFELGLSVQYSDFEDNLDATNSIDTYQSFLTLTTVLPLRAGQAQ